VQRFMNDDAIWREAGKRCMTCYENQHSVQAIVGNYESLFDKLLLLPGQRG
jgi:hypothetical protein